jgi:hypothetical protein
MDLAIPLLKSEDPVLLSELIQLGHRYESLRYKKGTLNVKQSHMRMT